jgi:DNA-binding LytR/AlgR family response regulator
VLLSYVENVDNLEVVGTCYNALEAMQLLKQHPVDLIFLDIKMPRLLGTELIRTLRHPPRVIFTTAHKDYALEGFDLGAVDYLLKPFSFERFLKAVNKLSGGEEPSPEAANGVTPFLYFRVDRKMVRVGLDEIVYIESLKDYSRMVRTTGSPLVMKRSISSIEEMLPENLFLRIHRSYIISIQKVTAYTQHDIEIGGQEIPIGKLYRHQLTKLAQSATIPPEGSSPG